MCGADDLLPSTICDCFAWAAEQHRRGPACGPKASDFMSARGAQKNQLDTDEWACNICTYLNHSRHLICGMCHTERGTPTASGGAWQAAAEPGVQAGAHTTADDESIVLVSAAMHSRRRGRERGRGRFIHEERLWTFVRQHERTNKQLSD